MVSSPSLRRLTGSRVVTDSFAFLKASLQAAYGGHPRAGRPIGDGTTPRPATPRQYMKAVRAHMASLTPWWAR